MTEMALRRNVRSRRQRLPSIAAPDRSARFPAQEPTHDGAVARRLLSAQFPYRSQTFFFLPHQSPFDASWMDLESKTLSYPPGQRGCLQRWIFRLQLFDKAHHLRTQLMSAPWPG